MSGERLFGLHARVSGEASVAVDAVAPSPLPGRTTAFGGDAAAPSARRISAAADEDHASDPRVDSVPLPCEAEAHGRRFQGVRGCRKATNSHADQHVHGCPSAPAMQQSGGADLAAVLHRRPRTPESQAQEQEPRRHYPDCCIRRQAALSADRVATGERHRARHSEVAYASPGFCTSYDAALLLATDESQGGWAEHFGGCYRSGGRCRGAEIASCELGSARRGDLGPVFAGICAGVIVAGVVGVGSGG
jgi:hypothetical protein